MLVAVGYRIPSAEAVVGQVEAGSMVQVSGEDDVYAFLTMLNIQYYKVLLERLNDRVE